LALSSHHHVYNGKRFVSLYPCIVILEQDTCIHSLNKNSSRCHAASAVLAMLHYGIFSFSGACHSWLQKFFRLELWELGTLKILAEQFCYYFVVDTYVQTTSCYSTNSKSSMDLTAGAVPICVMFSCIPKSKHIFLSISCIFLIPLFAYPNLLGKKGYVVVVCTVCHCIFIPVLSSPHSLVFGSSIHTENLPLDTRNIWHALFIAEPLYEANAN